LIVRRIEPGDENSLIEMGQRMWEESPRFNAHPLSIEKLVELAKVIHTSPTVECFVAQYKNKIIGSWIGFQAALWYSNDTTVSDLVFYVDVEHRGSSAAFKLIKSAENWAKSIKANSISVGISSGIDTEKTTCFFEKMGYTHGATLVTKNVW